jgi:hypothetical protein
MCRRCPLEQALQAAAPAGRDPGRDEGERQALERIAPPADEIVAPDEDLRAESEHGADPRRAPGPGARQRRAHDGEL